MRYFIYLIFLAIAGVGCTGSSSQFQPFQYGKVDKKISINGLERLYTIHVPSGYTGNKQTPLVFVLHDLSSSGSEFYDQSQWAAVCQKENIFAVFPTASSYCIQSGAISQTVAAWNAGQVSAIVPCTGANPANDVDFINLLLERLRVDFNIDKSRVYVTGFGNGGEMAARAGLELGDKIAAVAEFAGSFSRIGTWVAKRNVPVLFQVGNEDKVFFNNNTGVSMSDFATAMRDQNNALFPVVRGYTTSYGLSENFVIAGDTNHLVKASFFDSQQNNLLEVSLLKGVGHVFPSGNGGFMAAELQWNWLKQYQLP